MTTEPKGYVIIFKEAFLEKTKDKNMDTLLKNLENYQSIVLEQNSLIGALLFEILCKEIEEEAVQTQL